MKILFLSTYSTRGGAAIAASRTYQAIRNLSHNSLEYRDIDLAWLSSNVGLSHKLKNTISQRLIRLASPLINRQSIDLFPSRIHRLINRSGADIVHIHWCQDEFLPIESIIRIQRPIVWTLHDHWPFQGSCHLPPLPAQVTGRYAFQSIHRRRKQILDLDAWCFNRKALLTSKNITFTAPSSWLSSRLSNSDLFQSHTCLTIPNPVDISETNHLTKIQSRADLGLPSTHKLVLYVANSFTTDPNKGYSILLSSLNYLSEVFDFSLVTVGDNSHINLPCNHFNLGRIDDHTLMTKIYKSCDVLVIPSIYENMPQVAIESILSGTPVAGFACGGLLDIITPPFGRLVQPYSAVELASALHSLLQAPVKDFSRSPEHINFASVVSSSSVAKQYVQLYRQIVTQQ